MQDRPDGEPPAESEPPPEAVKAAHDAMLRLNGAPVPADAVADEPPEEQPSDHGYDHYDT